MNDVVLPEHPRAHVVLRPEQFVATTNLSKPRLWASKSFEHRHLPVVGIGSDGDGFEIGKVQREDLDAHFSAGHQR